MGERIYPASSWKNRDRVRALSTALRAEGHEVFDFTDKPDTFAGMRCAAEIPPERFPELFDPEKHVYRTYLTTPPEWRRAVEDNRRAIEWCETVVLMLPCGMDAHADAFYGLGLGRRLIVCGQPRAGERTPTHLWAEALLDADADVVSYLKEHLIKMEEPRVVRVARARPNPGECVRPVRIEVSGDMPEFTPATWRDEARSRYNADGRAVVEALLGSLPGGTVDAVEFSLLQERASLLSVRRLAVDTETADAKVYADALESSLRREHAMRSTLTDAQNAASRLHNEKAAVTRELRNALRHIDDNRYCVVHGSEGCVECEKRCEECGDDGQMFERDGDRLCENCTYDVDQDMAAEARAEAEAEGEATS